MSAESAFSNFFVKKGDAYVRLYWVYIIIQIVALKNIWDSLVSPIMESFPLFFGSTISDRYIITTGMLLIIFMSAAILIPLSILCWSLQVRIAIHPANRTITQRYALGLKENTISFDDIAQIQFVESKNRLQPYCVILHFAHKLKKRWYPFSNQIYLIFGYNREEMREVMGKIQSILNFDDSKLRITNSYFRR